MREKRPVYVQEGKVPCPNCGYEFDAFMGANSNTPQPKLGDIGMCLECGDLHWFTTGGPVSLSKEEYQVTIEHNTTLRQIIKARSEVMEAKKK